MKLAIMQPYIFPYIGYFQLIKAANRFVFYDDVTFIKQGWINRNNILINGKSFLFTVPLKDVSSNKLIRDTAINQRNYRKWKENFYKTIELCYGKAPYSTEIFPIIKKVFDSGKEFISDLASESIIRVCEYLDIKTEFMKPDTYNNNSLKNQDRVLDICKKEKADTYINAAGGRELYSKITFKENGIDMFFLQPLKIDYVQFNNEFVPWLSIIDVLMFNSIESVNNLMEKYELL